MRSLVDRPMAEGGYRLIEVLERAQVYRLLSDAAKYLVAAGVTHPSSFT